jgi:alpha-L-fucosidase
MHQAKFQCFRSIVFCLILTAIFAALPDCAGTDENNLLTRDERMKWWREARFGLFIHWGLYAIPAGEWGGETHHGEWIMHTAEIPLARYEKLRDRFNPVKFDADAWVRTAKSAGMKYIVITSKHHDGFCLFDSRYTDYDIMSTPFKRDILKELADACRRHGLQIGWYHSIMDWHHPDYLPRRAWEDRPAEGADFNRYVEHMRNQVRELITRYGPIGVMWFDGEWEGTWTHEQGLALYALCRELQIDVIVNNRVDKGRGGMAGLTVDDRYAGDFGTPEQEIPATGFPGVDWETCMTMNRHWGYNKHDSDYKSEADLIRKLADIASKGGNFLLNVGPTAEGMFPPESLERLKAMGEWMEKYSESIYATQASPFADLEWGRCTRKALQRGNTRLYFHVFNWPAGGELTVPGIYNRPIEARLLDATGSGTLPVTRRDDALIIRVPDRAPDPVNSVVFLDVEGSPDIAWPPEITFRTGIFVDSMRVTIATPRENAEIRYTTDGRDPGPGSDPVTGPVILRETTLLKARIFREGKPVSPVQEAELTRVIPSPAQSLSGPVAGLEARFFTGDWDHLPDFDKLDPAARGTVSGFDFTLRDREERFGFEYIGYLHIPKDGAYTFYLNSDDGSRMYVDGRLVVDNDGLHSPQEESGVAALSAGFHSIRVLFFEKTGGDLLEVYYDGPGIEKQRVPESMLYHVP